MIFPVMPPSSFSFCSEEPLPTWAYDRVMLMSLMDCAVTSKSPTVVIMPLTLALALDWKKDSAKLTPIAVSESSAVPKPMAAAVLRNEFWFFALMSALFPTLIIAPFWMSASEVEWADAKLKDTLALTPTPGMNDVTFRSLVAKAAMLKSPMALMITPAARVTSAVGDVSPKVIPKPLFCVVISTIAVAWEFRVTFPLAVIKTPAAKLIVASDSAVTSTAVSVEIFRGSICSAPPTTAFSTPMF